MVTLIARKFNEEQLLLETFFLKIHIERNTYLQEINFQIHGVGVKTSINKAAGRGSGGFNMLFKTSLSNIFHARTFAGSFGILQCFPAF